MRIKQRQIGFALAEMLLAVAITSVIIGIGASVYARMREGIRADEQGAGVIELAKSIQVFWRNSPSYGSVAGSEVYKIGLVRKPMTWNGTSVLDTWGNSMSLVGGSTSFVITVGGASNPMWRDDCASIATRLGAGIAADVSIGTSAAAGTGGAAGTIVGGNAYKSGLVINQAGLTTGCNEANPTIAASFR